MDTRLRSKLGVALIAATAWLTTVGAAHAQSYPTKPVRLITGLTPGSSTDILGRIIANELSKYWGQSVIVENRAGAGGNIGADAVAKAEGDGYTLLFWNVGIAIAHSYYRKLPYNALTDLATVSQTTLMPQVVCVSPSLPIHSINDLIAYAKSHPGQVFFSSAGNGQTDHMAAELFAHMTGIKVTHVPYKGGPQALTAVMAGEVAFDFPGLPVALPHVKSGKVRAIAVTTAKRSPIAPEIPTIAESGVPGYDHAFWTGVFAPANTPEPIVAKVSKDIAHVLKLPAVQEQLAKQGVEAVGSTPAQFSAFFKTEVERFAKLVEATGIKGE